VYTAGEIPEWKDCSRYVSADLTKYLLFGQSLKSRCIALMNHPPSHVITAKVSSSGQMCQCMMLDLWVSL